MTLINRAFYDRSSRCSVCHHLLVWHIRPYIQRNQDTVAPCEHMMGEENDYNSPSCKCTYYFDCISEEDIL